jgi:hypothetical protein
MRAAFPSVRLGSAPANVSRNVLPGAAERERRLIQLWGRDLYDELTRMNELDLELFERAGDEIRRRLSLVPRVAERMADLGARCRELTSNAV